jgi:hypothetical protein
MTNALTGDYEAVFEIAIPQLNGLLGTLHQNRGIPGATPVTPHSETGQLDETIRENSGPTAPVIFNLAHSSTRKASLSRFLVFVLSASSSNQKCAVTFATKRRTLQPMAEWLILLLLVPAVVAPIVLVFGFAGCSFAPLQEPAIDSATGTSFNTISVAWEINPPATVAFQRTNLDSTVTDLGVQAASPFTDTVPTPTDSPSLVYQYLAYNTAGGPQGETEVSGKTYELTFDGMLNPAIEGTGAEGQTQVQRIEPAYPLTKSSIAVQILLQADAASGASIDAIYISQADPNQPNEPWQPAADLTQVPLAAQPFILPPGGAVVALAPVLYALDNSKPLLIAINYSASPASGVKASNPLPITRASVYYKPGAEAGLQTRSAGYNLITTGDPTLSAVNLIANIYVFVG